MFQADDADDFTLGSSSKLASLFGVAKSLQEDNTSLTYTAPKQPKKGHHVESQIVKGQTVGQSSGKGAKLSIIAVKAVQTYKLADGNYNGQGKLGVAVLGNVESRVYQLLLYKGKQQHVTSVRISPTLQFMVQANNYATFYDDQMQNWSVMFESSGDAIEFVREVGLARANSMGKQGDQNMVTQDLLPGVGTAATEGDIVSVRYVAYPLTACKLGEEVEDTRNSEKPQRVKLVKGSWEDGLLGVAKGCKRMIILPPFLMGPWKDRVPADSSVVLEVDIAGIKPGHRLSLTDSGDSAVDSSTEDMSIKARGASISEALTNSPKTYKASIISRMAKMGQATLPLKGAVACDPSDSEEMEDDVSCPVDTAPSVVCKMPVKVRLAKTRTSSSPVQNAPMMGGIVPQQLTVYQPVPTPSQAHQYMGMNGPVTCLQHQGQYCPLVTQQAGGSQQMFPLPSSAISTQPVIPSDPHLSIFLADMRTQNLEVRMGVAKAVDKVEQVLMKLDGMQHSQMLPAMEPSTLLTSIQKLVTDNEQLRAELVEKRQKLDQHNEKMCELLHSNQKYLEQCRDSPMQTIVITLQQEKAKLSSELSEAVSRVSALELQVASASKDGQGLSEKMSAILSQLQDKQLELENSQQLVQEQKQQLQAYNKSVADLQAMRDELEGKLQQFREKESDREQQMDKLVQSHQVEIAKLREELKGQQQNSMMLLDRVRTLQAQISENSSGAGDSSTLDEVKKVMNILYHRLQPQFMPGMSYDGLHIRQIFMTTIRDVTLKYMKLNSTSEQPSIAANGTTSGQPSSAAHITTSGQSSSAARVTTSGQPSSTAHITSGQPSSAAHGTTSGQPSSAAHDTSGQPGSAAHDTTSGQPSSVAHGMTSGQPSSAAHDITSGQPSSAAHDTISGQPSSATHGTTSEQPSIVAHGTTSGQPSNAVHGTTSGDPSSAACGTTSEQPSNAAHVTSGQPSSAALETHVQVDAMQVPKHEPDESRTENVSSVEKLAARENADSIQNSELQTVVSGLAGLVTSVTQENDTGSVAAKEKEDGSGQVTTQTGVTAVTDGVENRQVLESVEERSWRPQPPPPPLFEDDDGDDDDDDWLS